MTFWEVFNVATSLSVMRSLTFMRPYALSDWVLLGSVMHYLCVKCGELLMKVVW
jgi:hypothetical protein